MLAKQNMADPRVRRTRQLLERAFSELMQEKGFQALTVQDISDRATVNRATFYAHFEDKYALLDSFIREGFEQSLSLIVPASEPFSPRKLSTLITAVFEYLGPLHDGCARRPPDSKVVEPLVIAAVQEELHSFILAWLQRLPVMDAAGMHKLETAATTMSWAIFGAGVQWSRGDRKQPAAEVASHVAAVLIGGLAGSLGLADAANGAALLPVDC